MEITFKTLFFFQARKSDEDVQAICDMCVNLKVSQIIKLLNLYTPADEFEERVSPSFVRKIQAKLQDRAAKESEQQVRIYQELFSELRSLLENRLKQCLINSFHRSPS